MPTSDYTPSIQQVANQLLSRTKDRYGNEVGTFNANTRPTDTQVTSLITEITGRVSNFIGEDIPPPLFDDASSIVAMRTAMQIELDFFPEQIATARSPYDRLEKLYEADLAKVGRQVQVLNDGGELIVTSAVPTTKARGHFPHHEEGFQPIGWRTLW